MKKLFTHQQFARIILPLLSIFLTFCILGAFIYKDWDVLFTQTWEIAWVNMIYAFLLLVLGMLIAALVWGDLLHSLGSRVSLGHHLRYYFISQLAKRLPGTVWYIAERGYFYKQHGDSVGLIAVASSIELSIAIFTGILITFVCLSQLVMTFSFNYWLLTTVLLIGLVVLLTPRSVHFFMRWLQRDKPLLVQYSYPKLLSWILCYIVLWLLGGMVLYFNINILYPLAFQHILYIIGSWTAVGTLSVLVFFLPTNLGFTEIGLSLLLVQVLPSSLAAIITVASRVLILLYEIMGTSIVLLAGKFFITESSTLKPEETQ